VSTDPMLATAPHADDFVQSLERGLAVIKAFDAEDRELTLSEVARKTGLTRAAARRFLHTLVALGYMRSDSRKFSLRPLVLELGYAYLSGLSLPEIAQPHMEELTATVHECTSISVLDGDMVVYVARVTAKRIVTVGIAVGSRFPAYATSMGRVLLAFAPRPWLDDYLAEVDLHTFTPSTVSSRERLGQVLAQVRREGLALVDQELEEGLRSIAVPLHDPQGAVIAAMNISTHVSRGDLTTVRAELLAPLRRTVAAIEADLRIRS
jgi:IclR family pca regulon transcriptional regulator